MKPKNTNHQVRRYEEHTCNVAPRFNSNNLNTPATVIPKYASKDHNVAGQIKTRIHLKNARGEEMDIYQTQQVLNLLKGDTSSWFINSGSGNKHYTNNNRRK